MARTTSMLVSMTFSPTRLRPASTASTVPEAMPRPRPLTTRPRLTHQVLLQLAVGDQLAGGSQHRAGRGDRVRVEDPDGRRQLPGDDDEQRPDEALHRPRDPAVPATDPAVGGGRVDEAQRGAPPGRRSGSSRRRPSQARSTTSSGRQEGLALERRRRASVDADRHVADERDAVQDPVAVERARSRGARGAAWRGCPRRRPRRAPSLKRTVYSGRASSANSRSSTWRLSRGDRSTISVVNDGLT